MTTITMPVLYERLKEIGFDKDYVRSQGLPTWWDDELDADEDVVLEGAAHISRRLRLDLLSLLEERSPEFKPALQTKFKYHAQNKADTPDAAHQIASSVAAVIARATELEFKPVPPSTLQVRAEILAEHPQINLNSLLDYCWKHGIAVVYFKNYPKKKRTITGMIQWHGDQPVIVLSDKRTNPAWLAFHLAHELGHLAFGHVKKGEGILVDDDIKDNSSDSEEIESNKFAVSLLLDNLDNAVKKRMKAPALAKYLGGIAQNNPTVDPCAIAFNFAWHNTNYFAVAVSAVKILDENQCGSKIIQSFLENHIDWDDLSDDVGDRLEQILGV
jgi:Zn-dependent peptidase ImmA (M78 family)